MNGSSIQLRPIKDLLTNTTGEPVRYVIHDYQRGYRWKESQVIQLLKDILDFTERPNPQQEDYYCLQPLVIKKSQGGSFEVVDGQQRLTTLLLILRYFNERLTENYRSTLFQIEYRTRPKLNEFLEEPNEKASDKNIDCFHLYQAIQAIREWFSENANIVEEIKSALLNKTKVIWFVLSEQDNSVDAFTRLNVGKIPLTDDELIRALFLRQHETMNHESHELAQRMAHEWDELEKSLQRDAFWYFLSNNPAPRHNRIGLIFDLVASNKPANPVEKDDYSTFYIFNEHLKDKSVEQVERVWHKVKKTFMALEEWYEDRELFHVAGFLIHQGEIVNDLLELSQLYPKHKFNLELRRRAFRMSIGNGPDNHEESLEEAIRERCESVNYGKDPESIRAILLLFNIATLLKDRRSNMRFQFDNFKNEEWDIEHVRSIKEDRPERDYERNDWFQHCLRYIDSRGDNKELTQGIERFLELSQKEANDEFDQLYREVLKYFNEVDEGGEDGISNLTLLDKYTNRSYKNAVFAVKRQRLLKLDKSGIFVPLCTRNVFLKCYSTQVDNVIFWNSQDAKEYGETIIRTLTSFFRPSG